MKKLLGLESFPFTEEEIVRRIRDAQRKHLKEVVFSTPNRTITISIGDINPAGMMRGYCDYYAK
ncbi:hypothetical protein HN734_00275 [Candidatus Woesearchaeota archaeon]|nr:hypothetical protein [Candidatus Woesearchaeota archaeon]MBT5924184.1 hypothetical protein [Candidatus Woesearchaeota archaeon]MBT6367153.1 hypothetical protein [Candidatus Woesearchaeota archaeon]MBT7762273.1 hypothetical protein [Candidatus Woesearchaeota archaeon]